MVKSLQSKIRYKTFTPVKGDFLSVSGVKSFGEKAKLVKIWDVKTPDMEEKAIRFAGTSEVVDRDNEVVKMDGWDMTNYVNNPIVLWMHENHSLPIGKTVGIYKDEVNKVIYFDVLFTEVYDFAKTVKALIDDGILKAVSLGFMVKDWMWDDKTETLILTENELFELSIVNVPANQEALIAEDKAAEGEHIKTISEEQFAEVVSKLDALASKVESMEAKPEVPPVDDKPTETDPVEPPAAEGDKPTEPEVPPVEPILGTPDINISEEAMALIVEAVVNRISQTNQEVTPPIVESPGDENNEEPLDGNKEPEPKPEAGTEEDVVVSIGDLDELEQFVIINEEEN